MSHGGGFGVALVWLWWSLGVAVVEPWWRFRVAVGWPWGGFRAALGCLCTPESMPSICILYGFGVALGGFARSLAPISAFCFCRNGALGGLQPFLVQSSRFDVQRSTFSLRPRWAQSSLRRVSGETPMSLPGSKPDGMGAAARRSGVGPGAVPCGSRKALTARHLRR